MTAKRFTIENDVEMKDNWNINKRCYHFGNGFDAKDCCNMLNELVEENIKIKKNCNRTHKEYAELIDCISDLGYLIIIRNGKVVLER